MDPVLQTLNLKEEGRIGCTVCFKSISEGAMERNGYQKLSDEEHF